MKQDIPHEDLLADIDLLCEEKSLTASEFGVSALNDPSLVFDLRKGRELRRKTEAKVKETIENLRQSVSPTKGAA